MSSRIALLAAVFRVVFMAMIPVTKVRSLIRWHFKLLVFYENTDTSFFCTFDFKSILTCAEDKKVVATSAALEDQGRFTVARQRLNTKTISDLFFMRALVLLQRLKLEQRQ